MLVVRGASFGAFAASEEKSPNYKELERPWLRPTPFLEEGPEDLGSPAIDL